VNCFKANWRQAGWSLQKHKEVLYDIAWAGLNNSVKNNVRPMTADWGRYDAFDEVFDKAAASEVKHVENEKHQQQQQQQDKQHQQKPLTYSSSTGGKNGYRPSISETAETTAGGRSGQSGLNRNRYQAAEDNGDTYHQHDGSQWKTSKVNVLPANAYDRDLRTTMLVSALNTHDEVTHLSRTRH
jgi:hypothetical protein